MSVRERLAKRALTIGLVSMGALALVETAGGALVLGFEEKRASPGQTVRIHTANSGTPNAFSSPVDVYLVRVAYAERISGVERSGVEVPKHLDAPPDDPHLIPVGRLAADVQGCCGVSFTLPDVPPGEYTTAVFCRPCGNSFFTMVSVQRTLKGPSQLYSRLQVLPRVGAQSGQGAFPWWWIVAGVTGGAIVIGGGLILRRQRSAT
jgi:hypothetical protein